MSKHTAERSLARRSFLSRLTAAAAAFGAMSATAAAQAPAPSAVASSSWQPARHSEDDWFDETPAKHRFFMDTTTAPALDAAMGFARNFLEASASGYKLTDADSAQIICLRHLSTSFAFTDEMWSKYSAGLSERAEFVDPGTRQPPTANPHAATLNGLAKRGVRYAVCAMATRRTASVISQKTGAKIDDVFKELSEHLIANAHLVPAGIVAVNRAHERGYAVSTVIG